MGLRDRHALIVAVATALLPAAVAAAPNKCPDEAAVHQTIRRSVTAEWMRKPGVRTVDRFAFGRVEYDDVMRLELTLIGDGYHCAVQVTYTFRAVMQNGEERTARLGTHDIHAFRVDAFGDWEFRTQLVTASAGSAEVAQAPAPAAFACPSDAEVRTAIEKWNVAYHKDAFRIRSIGDFKFGPVTFAPPTRASVDGGAEVDTCPTRITFSYVLTGTNGSQSTSNVGEGQIYWFYRNPFGEWAYRTSRG